jgi:hypothetical protein
MVAASSKKRKAAAVLILADPIPSAAPQGPPPTRGGPSGDPPCKKKSPLYNQPQNFYAPPASSVSAMTKDDLSAWRKEQRRKRNRESAAASRGKTRKRIDELEGEVSVWKGRCEEMRARMAGMERHLGALMRQAHNANQLQQQQQQHTHQGGTMTNPAAGGSLCAGTNRVVSQPNSPPRGTSPALATAATVESNVPFYPPLVSAAPIQPTVSTGTVVSRVVPHLALSNANAIAPQPYFSPPLSPQDHALKRQRTTPILALETKQKRATPSSSSSSDIVHPNQGVAEIHREEECSTSVVIIDKKEMQHIIRSRQA